MQETDLSWSDRVRIATLLYKVAIREIHVAKRPVPTKDLVPVLDRHGLDVSGFIKRYTPSTTVLGKPPSVRQALASRTNVPGEGLGVRLYLSIGPFTLKDHESGAGIVGANTTSFGGMTGLVDKSTLHRDVQTSFGGINGKLRWLAPDARSKSDRPFRVEHGYIPQLSTYGWKVIHNGGPHDGKVLMYEDPKVLAQLEQYPDLDPWKPAVFNSSLAATKFLNGLTGRSGNSTRPFPVYKEFTFFVTYVADYPSSRFPDLYNALSNLLSAADDAHDKSIAASEAEKGQLIQHAVGWLVDRGVSVDVLLTTLKSKDPELAQKIKAIVPDIINLLPEAQKKHKKELLTNLVAMLRRDPALTPKQVIRKYEEKKLIDQVLADKYRELIPEALQALGEAA